MDTAPVADLGPPPFRFHPAGGCVRGAAYSVPFRVLATALVGGTALWMGRLWSQGQLGQGWSAGLGWLLAALALMAWTWWCMLVSVTTIDGRRIHQTFVWDKEFALGDLAYAKLVRLRGLDWLVAPRLYARTLAGKFAVFHAADPGLVAEFERLVVELRAFRQL